MLLSRHWLERYLDLNGIRNQQITEALNNLGFEVENTTDFKSLNDALVIGHIEESKPIPNTKLTTNKVRVGAEEYLSIVCGAPNVKRNQYVIVAKPQQKIASGQVLTTRQIQGVESEGMICALNEIGISEKSLVKSERETIYDLGHASGLSTLVGRSIRHIGMDDFIWNLDLTVNRGDALSAFQIAKELAHHFQIPMKWPLTPNAIALLKPKTEIQIDKALRSQVISLVGKSLEVRSGTPLLTNYHNLLLKKLGIPTTTNFYEDLANLNSWETGQPLILIDRNKLLGTLTLQWMRSGEKNLLVLTSNGELVQIIGQPTVPNFAVDENTKTILALALKVDEQLMRQQAQHLPTNIALQRYTKPLSVALQEMGLKNYERLLANYRLLRAKSPIKHWVKPLVSPNQQISTTLEHINQFLGTHLTHKDLVKIFKNSDFVIKVKNNQLLIGVHPTRTDVQNENDMMEEVARLYGYNRIPTTPLNLTLQKRGHQWMRGMENQVQSYLNALGFFNIKTYSLVNEAEIKQWNLFGYETNVAVMAPLSLEHTHYRQSLIPSLLKVASLNAVTNHKNFKFWEIADIYEAPNKRYHHLVFGAGGQVTHDPLNHIHQDANYSYIKGIVEALLNFYNLKRQFLTFEPLDSTAPIHPYHSAKVKYRNKVIGYIVRPASKLLNQLKLPATYVAELNLESLARIGARNLITYQPLNKFQPSQRALSFVLSPQMTFQEVIKQLLSHVHHLVEWSVIDHYQDKEMVANNEQALTISFVFNHAQHQLTDAEINHQWTKILNNAKKLQLKVR